MQRVNEPFHAVGPPHPLRGAGIAAKVGQSAATWLSGQGPSWPPPALTPRPSTIAMPAMTVAAASAFLPRAIADSVANLTGDSKRAALRSRHEHTTREPNHAPRLAHEDRRRLRDAPRRGRARSGRRGCAR